MTGSLKGSFVKYDDPSWEDCYEGVNGYLSLSFSLKTR